MVAGHWALGQVRPARVISDERCRDCPRRESGTKWNEEAATRYYGRGALLPRITAARAARSSQLFLLRMRSYCLCAGGSLCRRRDAHLLT